MILDEGPEVGQKVAPVEQDDCGDIGGVVETM